MYQSVQNIIIPTAAQAAEVAPGTDELRSQNQRVRTAVIDVSFRDCNGNGVSEAAALSAYFGVRPGDTMAEFLKEVQALEPGAKTELATLAAAELGYVVL
jgi:hypothetical protein